MRWRDSLLPINHLGKRCTKTAEKPIEFDLSFMDPETASFRPRGQKPRVDSLGINPCSHSSEYRPAPCCLEAWGVNGETQVKGRKTAKKKPPSQRGNGGSIIEFTHQCRWRLCCDSRTKRNSAAQCGTQKCRSEPCQPTPIRWLQFCRPVIPVAPSFWCRFEPSAARQRHVVLRRPRGQKLGQLQKLFSNSGR